MPIYHPTGGSISWTLRQNSAFKAWRKSVCMHLLLQYLLQSCLRGDSGGHVLRETTSRGLYGLVYPLHTSERGGEGDCVKVGGGEEGEHERERAGEVRLYYSLGY